MAGDRSCEVDGGRPEGGLRRSDEDREVIERLKTVEKEMGKIADTLSTEYNYSFGDPLVDSEKYPRSDIDVYNISKTLSRYKEMQRTWKDLRSRVEERILEIYGRKDGGGGESDVNVGSGGADGGSDGNATDSGTDSRNGGTDGHNRGSLGNGNSADQ